MLQLNNASIQIKHFYEQSLYTWREKQGLAVFLHRHNKNQKLSVVFCLNLFSRIV